MKMGKGMFVAAAAGLWLAAAPVSAAGDADMILVNGRIATVDDRGSMVEALAIKGQRIIATGSTTAIRGRAGSATKVIDLGGKTVIPGLIDNHAHFVRVAEKWHWEMRLDGITSRKEVAKMITDRVQAARPGEWIVALGGWSEEQFTDDPRGFPLAELDQLAPNNPVVLQAVYRHSYLNTAALKAARIDAATADPRGGRIEKDATGNPTGLVTGAGGVAFIAAKVPLAEKEQRIYQKGNDNGEKDTGDAKQNFDKRIDGLPFDTGRIGNKIGIK